MVKGILPCLGCSLVLKSTKSVMTFSIPGFREHEADTTVALLTLSQV